MRQAGWNLQTAAVELTGDQAGRLVPDFLRYLQGIKASATTGTVGPAGPAGANGATGPGVPAGGSSGQVLKKLSGTDYDTGWLTLATIATSGSASDLTSGTVPAARMPALTGDITTSAGAVATTLATVNANTGSWGSATQAPVITLDAKGRATAASNVTITPAFSSLTGKPTTLSGYGITDAQPLDSDLTAIAALTTTSYGRGLLTSASATALMNGLSASDLSTGTLPDARLSIVVSPGSSGDATHTTALTWDAHGRITGATPTLIALPAAAISGLAAIATSGSASDLGAGTLSSTRLPTSGVTAGSYGDGSHVAQVAVDPTGRVTSASSVAIAIASGAVSGLATIATSGAITDATGTLAVLHGGTGATTASGARTSMRPRYGLLGAEAAAVIEAMSAEPRRSVTNRYDDLISGLVDAGIFSLLDWLFAPGIGANSQACLLDLVNPSRSWSLNGTTLPIVTPFQGVQGDGSTSYLELGLHANAGQFALNDASYGFVLRTERAAGNTHTSVGWAAAQTTIQNNARSATPSVIARLNDGGSGASYPASTSAIGFFAASRQGSTSYNIYVGRSADTAPTQTAQTVTSTTGPVAQNWQLLGMNSVGQESAQLSLAWAGKGLSQTEINTLFSLVKTALQASGAWV